MNLPTNSQREIEEYKKLLPLLDSQGFDFSQSWICDYVVEKSKEFEGVHWSGVASFFVQLCELDDHTPLFRVLMSDTESGKCFRQISPLLKAGQDFLVAMKNDSLIAV